MGRGIGYVVRMVQMAWLKWKTSRRVGVHKSTKGSGADCGRMETRVVGDDTVPCTADVGRRRRVGS